MKVMDLLSHVRAKAGDVRLHPSDDARLQFKRGWVKPAQWKAWKETLVRNKYLVAACLKEERASAYWGASGHNPLWWQAYPHGETAVLPCCTCYSLPFAHNHTSPGRRPNMALDADEVWEVLARVLDACKGRP